ncbi:MAG: metallophosphoesterase [Nanoarchaeota archaeon]|nr:metallophosphoesterase [Nanoarchaeota archaeon]MBU1051753.1 metallophosphoesterase [Nanoarchaeota archaeon]MBU1988366.1 metallophosphoesterase [Nanoarchaeota archaeon]
MENLKYVGKCLLIEKDGEKVLVVGDLHLGYEESLGVPIILFGEMLGELGQVFENVGLVDKVVLIGDVKHEFGRIVRQEWNEVLGLFDFLKEKSREIIIVRGNHDKIIEPLLKRDGLGVKDFFIWKGYCFLHGDRDFKEVWEGDVKTLVVGHGHPAVKICDGVKEEMYKCFLVGKFKGTNVVVVPSFFSGSVGTDPRRSKMCFGWDLKLESFDVKVVGEGLEVLDFGKLGGLD